MRPERLRISAFGPYAGEEDMNFSVLENHTLFLICGPTGAGKSTILDAMCYALYGKTSGAVRSGEDLRSNYVGYDRKTYVEFDFAIGDRHYRIYRSPTQLLERQKGDRSKPVEHKGKADFYEIDEEGKEKAHITSKGVDSAVEKLLGVGLEQFRQIILLPQGDFRKLLLADSSDRQKIMEQLFQTGIYLAFEKKLQEETKKLESDYKQGKQTRVTLLETCHVEEDDALKGKIEENKKLLSEKEKVTKALSIKQETFQKEYAGASKLFDAFGRMEKAIEQLKRLEGEKKENTELRETVKMIKASQLVSEEWAAAESTRQQWKKINAALESILKGLPEKEKAKEYFMKAWEISKPDDLIEGIGEHHGLLQGLIETCMKKEHPDDYARIIDITYKFSAGWRRIHNPDTNEDVADNLTTTEFTIAMLANRGWTNKEIAEHLDITTRTVKQHLTCVFSKLNITNRKQLKDFMLR